MSDAASHSAPEATRYARAKALFLDALDQPPADRTTWLDTACPDPDLRTEVDALLAAHDEVEADGHLDEPFLARHTDGQADPWIGRFIGPWRLLACIGTGGMGAVYRAERADGAYDRIVAVKLLQSGVHRDMLAHRLHAEQQILARLEHPGVARFYDGGVTPDGLPFLVMELVDGKPLTAFADEAGLSLAPRLALFLQVCDAVAYAHRNLIVHRDLKPSNILVTDARAIKLLDFGIAHLLEDDGDAALHTRTQGGAMTPAYAAPEQLRRALTTTATDVYSLGVVLYELLTGRRPYELAGKSPAAMERIVAEDEPPRPSKAAGDARLQGDLDTIVLKAMAKEPERRYSTPEALGDDLRRYLDGRPVLARPATPGYRVQKFVRRNRVGVTAAAVTVLALFSGLGVALWQAHEARASAALAERRFDTARATAQVLIYDVHDAVETLPGATPVREVIVTQALTYLDRLAQDAGGDDALRLDLAQAYLRVGNVQGNPNNSNLGRIPDALASYRRGLAVLHPTQTTDSLRLATRHVRAVLLEKMGDLYAHLGHPDSALGYIDRALALFERNAQDDPDNPARRLAVAIEYLKRGDYTGNPNHPNAGQPSEALRYYLATLARLDRVGGEDSLRITRLTGLSYERLGSIYALLGETENAYDAYRRSLVIRERLAAAHPLVSEIQRDAAVAHEKLGLTYQADGRLDEARAELDEAHAGYRAIAEVDAEDASARITLAISEMHRGALMHDPARPSFGDRTAARVHYARALDLLQGVAALDDSNARVRDLIEEVERALAAL